MANTFSIISMVAFILSGIFFLIAIILFLAMDTRSAYLELKGQTQKKQITKENKKNDKKAKKQKTEKDVTISKTNVEDEAVTTLDNGEEATEVSLMNVYEPGTELLTEDNTEELTEVQTNEALRNEFWDEECATTIESSQITEEFRIIKRIIYTHSEEILR